MSLDQLVRQKAEQISYNKVERSNIAKSSNHLRGLLEYKQDFSGSYLGGSYKRSTMVKGISDVDVYIQYTGSGNPQTALSNLLNQLKPKYPNSRIKQDRPSILVDFVSTVPFNITPYTKDYLGQIKIPNRNLIHWDVINFGVLENKIVDLRDRNSKLIDLIKILKYWNFKYNQNIPNFRIEEIVYNQFAYNYLQETLSKNLYHFFKGNNYSRAENQMYKLMNDYIFLDDYELKRDWLKFIERK